MGAADAVEEGLVEFLFEALSYTQELYEKDIQGGSEQDRHVTGQELCQGIRQLAMERFGYMAKTVFEGWGIYRTDDFGEMVYLLIRNRLMAKRESDSLGDFRKVYEFSAAFEDVFSPSQRERRGARRKPTT